MTTNLFVPENDIYGRRSDGRRYLIAPAGVPILDIRARALGLIVEETQETVKPDPANLPGPSEIKIPEAEPLPVTVEDGSDVFEDMATESAIELANEYGVDLMDVDGSGKDGRILKRDVEALIVDQV